MKRTTTIILSAVILLMYSFRSDETPTVRDYLNIKTIQFDEKVYSLASSYNPAENHFNQEYLPETCSSYCDMVVLETTKTSISVDAAINAKIAELSEWQKKNPDVKWKITENNGEKILDFVLSDGESEYEWNLYRYVKLNDKKDKKMILCAYSYRENIPTDEEMKMFFDHMVSKKDAFVNELQKIDLSRIKME